MNSYNHLNRHNIARIYDYNDDDKLDDLHLFEIYTFLQYHEQKISHISFLLNLHVVNSYYLP